MELVYIYCNTPLWRCVVEAFSEVHVPDKLLLACVAGSGATYVI